ncbi:MAG: HEAT repeat domain-containing protein [Planctomycetota bacterium]
MRPFATILLTALIATADANLPAALKPLPKDGLAEEMDPDLRKALVAAHAKYDTRDEVAREAAVKMLEVILSPIADDDLIQIADNDGFPTVRLRAAEALLKRENRAASMCAARLAICGVPPTIRKAAADLVRKTGDEEAEKAFVKVLRYGSYRATTETGLGIDRPYNELAELLYRTMGATALGRVASPLAVTELIAALKDKEWEVRAACATALGDAGSKDAVAPLARALADEDVDVAAEAALALGRLGGAAAIAALEGAVKDKRPIVKRLAARALRAAKERAAVPPPPPAIPPKPPAGGGSEALPEERPPSRPLPPEEVTSPEGSLDLLFIIDSTFSMCAEWPMVNCQVQSEILRAPADGDVRVGFVLYRDFDNQWLTRQHYLSWDADKAWKWFQGQKATGGNAFTGSASDQALTVAAMLNLRRDQRPHVIVIADVPSNDDVMSVHRARLLHVFENAIVDGVYVDRDKETRGFMQRISEAGGGRTRAFRSGPEPISPR